MDNTAGIETAIRGIWHDIETWYEKNAPDILKKLAEGASDQQIDEFESASGLSLPDSYKTSLRLHNGAAYFHDYEYLDLCRVLGNWSRLVRRKAEGAFEGKQVFDAGGGIVQNTWWHHAWIPFAEDGGGNMLCIDLAPGTDGVAGQIIKMELGAGPVHSQYGSFLEWLEGYRNDLYAGRYAVDEYGYIVEKFDRPERFFPF